MKKVENMQFDKVNTKEIDYKPSLIGRIARTIIPLLNTVLPNKVYKVIYDKSYQGYKRLLRYCYLRRVIKTRLLGNKLDRLKTLLTFKLLPYTMGGWKALENAFEVTSMVEEKNIDGALVECGVAEGGTAAIMALTNRKIGNIKREKWFFDSYEGLPEPTTEDYERGKLGEFIRPLPKGACLGTIEQVSALMFDKLQFSKSDVHLVKGWFQDTVPTFRDKIGPIAVLRLDGDWYESTKIPLDNLYNMVSPGGFVIIDDYATCFGSRKAVDEFRLNHSISTPMIPDGRGGIWFEKA